MKPYFHFRNLGSSHYQVFDSGWLIGQVRKVGKDWVAFPVSSRFPLIGPDGRLTRKFRTRLDAALALQTEMQL